MQVKWSRVLLLLLLPLVIGIVVNYQHPKGLPILHSKQGHLFGIDSDLEMLSYERARKFHEEGMHLFVDVRTAKSYNKMHIPRAVLLQGRQYDKEIVTFKARYPFGTPIIVYCQSRRCPKSVLIGEKLKEEGYTDIKIYLGGMREWLGQD